MAQLLALPALASRFSPTKADLALKAEQQARSVKNLWILIACVIAFLALIRTFRFIFSLVASNHRVANPGEQSDVEFMGSRRNGKILWRRLPAASASAFRVVAFRLNIPVGPGSVASVAELIFILGYIVTMLTILLINSK